MYNTAYNNMFIHVPTLLTYTARTGEMKGMVQDVARTVGVMLVSTLKQQMEVQIRHEVRTAVADATDRLLLEIRSTIELPPPPPPSAINTQPAMEMYRHLPSSHPATTH